ncbi:DUF1659 domain-containing protein [Paenalkalicoccus suaedae]|uniref:DUF1659 domain-containing protein n=1 Tax=Paenalkalicoccus suaedae TaxID=2592382 RepID=A0A859FEN7_9BACI|nr:DUF1659 domain-containing protein [Paenalkalicoccus suaedae]QKS71813.1 DUF1659 domain-containing protein [Paenalkalicoccus suaedae]
MNTLLTETRLNLTFFKGLDEDNKEVFATRQIRNLREDASSEALHAVATAMASLTQDQLVKIERANTYEILA